VPITNGVPGPAETVPGADMLDGVGCANFATCLATGYNTAGQGVVVPIIEGVPGAAQAVPGTTGLGAVSCPSTTYCEVVGGGASDGVAVSVTVPAPPTAASFTYPLHAQTNVDTTHPFTWSPIYPAQGYYLTVGTTLYGTNLVNSGILPPTQSNLDMPSLPAGQTLYATLYTEIDGTWTNYQAITFTAAVGEATLTNPLNRQTGVDPTKAFTWTTIPNAQGYDLTVGTTPYATNVANTKVLLATQSAYTTAPLPADTMLYATLYTQVNGSWGRYQAIAFTTGPAMATLTNLVNGQTNIATPAPFTWTTISAAQSYDLTIGTTVYGADLANTGILGPSTSTFNVTALPPGKFLYATLYTETNNKWAYQEVVFTAK